MMRSLKYKPYWDLQNEKSVIVDGNPHESTCLILSHWRDSGTAAERMRDTSAEIVLDFIETGELPSAATCVSNDHFDEDGLVSIFALVHPRDALKQRELLIDVAEAGDFGKFKDRLAARIVFTLSTLKSPQSDFFDPEVFKRPYPRQASEFYGRFIPLLKDLTTKIENYRKYWQEEDDFLTWSERKCDDGTIEISELPNSDLAIVEIPDDFASREFHRFTQRRLAPVHEMAIHNRTNKLQIIYKKGSHYSFKYRYESWVQFQSQAFERRVDLSGLVTELNAAETPETGHWTYSGSEKITPELKNNGASSLAFEDYLRRLQSALKNSPKAWDPFEFFPRD